MWWYNEWQGGIVNTQMVVPASHTQLAPPAPPDLYVDQTSLKGIMRELYSYRDLCHSILTLWRQSLDMSKKIEVDGENPGDSCPDLI